MCAAISEYSESMDLVAPKGLKKIIQVIFQSLIDRIEKAIDLIPSCVGSVIRYQNDPKGNVRVCSILVFFELECFILGVNVAPSKELG